MMSSSSTQTDNEWVCDKCGKHNNIRCHHCLVCGNRNKTCD